jgi:hypothetical protein
LIWISSLFSRSSDLREREVSSLAHQALRQARELVSEAQDFVAVESFELDDEIDRSGNFARAVASTREVFPPHRQAVVRKSLRELKEGALACSSRLVSQLVITDMCKMHVFRKRLRNDVRMRPLKIDPTVVHRKLLSKKGRSPKEFSMSD